MKPNYLRFSIYTKSAKYPEYQQNYTQTIKQNTECAWPGKHLWRDMYSIDFDCGYSTVIMVIILMEHFISCNLRSLYNRNCASLVLYEKFDIIGYPKNHWTNDRLVCTNFNVLFMLMSIWTHIYSPWFFCCCWKFTDKSVPRELTKCNYSDFYVTFVAVENLPINLCHES